MPQPWQASNTGSSFYASSPQPSPVPLLSPSVGHNPSHSWQQVPAAPYSGDAQWRPPPHVAEVNVLTAHTSPTPAPAAAPMVGLQNRTETAAPLRQPPSAPEISALYQMPQNGAAARPWTGSIESLEGLPTNASPAATAHSPPQSNGSQEAGPVAPNVMINPGPGPAARALEEGRGAIPGPPLPFGGAGTPAPYAGQ